MPLHYEGYYESRQGVLKMTHAQLLDLIDSLYGRGNLDDDYDTNELREEALAQHNSEWTDTSSPEYEQVQFWTKVAKAG